MKSGKVKFFVSIIFIFILIFNLSFNVVVNATSSDLLISLGTGNYYIEVTKSSTVDDIIKVLGEPKLETPSAFGGNAYAFYTDDNYSNYLYIETTEDGTIASYGSIDPTYKTQTYSYGDDFPYSNRKPLYGYMFSNDGQVGGGVYYNISALNTMDYNEFINVFESEFSKDSTKYLMGLSKQGISMYNALSIQFENRDTTPLVFNEEYFYIDEQFKEFGSTIREYMIDIDKALTYMKGLGVKSSIDIAGVYYLLNPLMFGDFATANKYTTFNERTIPVFSYNPDSKELSAITLSSDAFNNAEKVEYTEEEKEKLEAGRSEYKSAIESFESANGIYETEPITTTASGLVAGKLNKASLEGITSYLNAIRVAGGIPKVQLKEDNTTVAQHKATLLSYRYDKLGLGIAHSPEKPEGVTDTFYNTAMGNNIGYSESVGQWTVTNPNMYTMMESIDILLDDSSEEQISFSHRQRILDSGFTNFGYGISPYVYVNEFNGVSNSDNYLEAWPSNGITFMETLATSKFYWTAQFTDKYTVQDTTTATVKCLNTGETWDFTEEEKTNDRWFACSTDSIAQLNNKVIMYDSSIVPQAGYVYEITLHGLKDDTTAKNVDYTYRSVFEYADVSNYADTIKSIEIEEPDLEKEGEVYQVTMGQEVKLNAKIDDTEVIDKKVTWTSSNEDVIEVKQNGELVIKKASSTPVTIRVSSDANGLSDSIQINVSEAPKYLKGDINNDGVIDILDLNYGLRKLVDRDITQEEIERGDVTDDGTYDILDVNKILRYLAREITEL